MLISKKIFSYVFLNLPPFLFRPILNPGPRHYIPLFWQKMSPSNIEDMAKNYIIFALPPLLEDLVQQMHLGNPPITENLNQSADCSLTLTHTAVFPLTSCATFLHLQLHATFLTYSGSLYPQSMRPQYLNSEHHVTADVHCLHSCILPTKIHRKPRCLVGNIFCLVWG